MKEGENMGGFDNLGGKSNHGNVSYEPIIFCTPAQTATLLKENRQLILLVRHGLTDWNAQKRLQGRENIVLNSTGEEQAYYCAWGLCEAIGSKVKVKSVFTSPLSRAYNTAALVCGRLSLKLPTVLPDLVERDYGSVTGMSLEERRAFYRKHSGYTDDIEPEEDAAQRMKSTIRQIYNFNGDGISIVITHGGLLNAFFARITKNRAGGNGNIAANCTVSVIAAGKKDILPIAFNLSGELLRKYIDGIS